VSDVAELTVGDAADALGMAPLEVLAWCALKGLPCLEGILDPGFEDILRAAGHAMVETDGDAQHDDYVANGERADVPPDPRERRLWVLRRVAGKLQRNGKWWPANLDLRAICRGVPDVGMARNAIEALEHAGLVRGSVRAGVHRVGLVGDRRTELAQLVERAVVTDPGLSDWIDG